MKHAAVTSQSQPLHIAAGEGERVWWIDGTVTVKVTAAESGGSLGVWEFDARRGAATPLRVHRLEDEYFVVLEGAATFFVGDERFDAVAGDFVLLPRDIPHAYRITSERARVLGMVAPGGHESFFTEVGAAIVPGEPEAPAPPIAALAAAVARHGGEVLGPPPQFDEA